MQSSGCRSSSFELVVRREIVRREKTTARRGFRSLLGACALILVLPVAPAAATPIELLLRGTVSTVTPASLDTLGVQARTPLEARIVYDSETPARGTSSGDRAEFDNPFLAANVRVGDLEFVLRGGCCDRISIGRESFSLDVGLDDSAIPERFKSTALRINLIAPDGSEFFPDTSLPRSFESLLPADLLAGLSPRVLGATNDPDAFPTEFGGASRFNILFGIDSISADPIPEPGSALLLGLGLAAMGMGSPRVRR